MENDIFDTSLSASDHNHGVFNAVSSNMFSSPFMQSGIIDHNMVNTHEQMIANNSMPSNAQEEFLNNLYIPNICGRVMISEGNSGDIGFGTSLANLLPSDVGSGDNSSTSALAVNMRLHDDCNLFHTLYPRNHDYSMVHPSYHVIGSNIPRWNLNDSNIYSLPRNGLSLTLGSDHCSEKSCSVVTQVTPKDSKELSLFCGPSSTVHFSHVLLGSRYLDVAQEVLGEVVKYALDNYEELDDSMSGIEGEARNSFSSSSSANVFTEVSSLEFTSRGSQEDVEHLMLEERKAGKTELLSMLQMVDRRYKQCSENIHNVIMAFHDATNSSSPQMLARFALHTFSSTFKKLREEIVSQILLFGQGCNRVKERTFEPSFIQKQWALQLGRRDQQSWRPQRGLPERSVTVLRAWMFQNFLHPYPKDNDKQLLAMQSGLTRSQVSNWFINARVRLWKPMIEEMYSEVKSGQPEEGIEGDFESHGNIGSQRP